MIDRITEQPFCQTRVMRSVLVNADCLEYLPTLENKSIDYSFTSPPYNRKRNDKYLNFTDINKNWLQLNIDVITELLRITKKHIFYFADNVDFNKLHILI